MTRRLPVILGFLVVSVIASPAVARADYLGPSSYLSFSDSPFASLTFNEYFYLEDFEDGLLDTPGVLASAGAVVGPGPLRDSVDNGVNGYSYYSDGSHEIDFFFSESDLGLLPTHVGFAWTDVGFSDDGLGFGFLEIEAWDRNGVSLGVFAPPTLFGDGSAAGSSLDDWFLGVVNAGGISQLAIRMPGSTDWEIDHLQYGNIPEPSAWLLGLTALAAARIARRVGSRRRP